MAKAKPEDANALPQRDRPSGRHESSGRNSHAANRAEDAEPLLALVHDSDYIPPHARLPVDDEKPVALKKRIAWGPPTADGSQSACFAPIPGLGYLWATDATDADPEPFSKEQATVPVASTQVVNDDERQGRRVIRFECDRASPKASAKPRGVKRGRPITRARSQRQVANEDDEYNGENDSDADLTPKRIRTETLYINNIEGLLKFYRHRFDELTMKPMRKIITEWVSRLEPQRQSKYGKYDNKLPSKRTALSPPWWPSDCPYREPSHLKREHLIPLAADLMLIHRDMDEQCGKRKKPWISQLRTQAVYIVDSIPAETFSSSREDVFNDSMKDRALKEILPNLFDVAEAHEDYVTQYELFEGSSNKDPLKGKYVTWKRCPRPYRGLTNKRPRYSKVVKPAQRELSASEDSGEETEVDDAMSNPSTSFSSFQSIASSGDDDVDVKRESSPLHQRPNMAPPTHIGQNAQEVQARHMATPYAVFDQSLNRLHLDDSSQTDVKPNDHFQTMQFPHNLGEPRHHTFAGMAGPIPTQTPAAFPFSQWPSNTAFAPHPNGLPLSGAMEDVQSTHSFQQMQPEPSIFSLPFGAGYIYGPPYPMPGSQPTPDYTMFPQSECHGLPMTMGG